VSTAAKTRGAYERDEVRTPLRDRVNGEWPVFEATLFNLVWQGDREINGYFSKRLEIAQRMLDAFDKEVLG
jgi:hypothetical protein